MGNEKKEKIAYRGFPGFFWAWETTGLQQFD
jgi:hypothetical protein